MIDVHPGGVGLALARMAKKKTATKMPEGGYSAYQGEAEVLRAV